MILFLAHNLFFTYADFSDEQKVKGKSAMGNIVCYETILIEET